MLAHSPPTSTKQADWFSPELFTVLRRLGFRVYVDGRTLCQKAKLSVVQLEDREWCQLAIAWPGYGYLELTIPTGDLLKAAAADPLKAIPKI